MSELRKQLQAARDDYRSARYPGDLVADLLGKPEVAGRIGGLEDPEQPRRSRWRLMLAGITAAAALAAAIAVIALLHRPATLVPGRSETNEMAVRFSIPAAPEMPHGISVTPPHVDLSAAPARPEFPSIFGTL